MKKTINKNNLDEYSSVNSITKISKINQSSNWSSYEGDEVSSAENEGNCNIEVETELSKSNANN